MTDEQWNAIKNCDCGYDGKFFYALTTTKTVCRPSCSSRTPNPKNVVIFSSVEKAMKQGFRPCNRCRPDFMEWLGAKQELTHSAKKYIENHYWLKFSLNEISESLYVNSDYLLRVFKYCTGNTLLWYHNFVRCQKAAKLLVKNDTTISYISCQVGFTSPSHFSEIFKKHMRCTPSQYRKKYISK